MKRFALVATIVASLALSACSDEKGAMRAASNMGIKNVQTQGWAMFGCGDHDTFKTKFTGTAPNGNQVSGVVCSGWLKGNTVRFD